MVYYMYDFIRPVKKITPRQGGTLHITGLCAMYSHVPEMDSSRELVKM